jgi:coenzyme PQQ precursor peptide PqqA
MIAAYRRVPVTHMIGCGIAPTAYSLRSRHYSELNMIWETPCAIDFRFGMEITMYIARR